MDNLVLIIGCIVVLFSAIHRVGKSAEGTHSSDVLVNSVTLQFIGGVAIVLIIVLAVLFM